MTANRTICHTQKVRTPFGNMFVHLEVDEDGRIAGGSISHKGKEPTSQVAQMVESLSDGLNECAQALSRNSNG